MTDNKPTCGTCAFRDFDFCKRKPGFSPDNRACKIYMRDPFTLDKREARFTFKVREDIAEECDRELRQEHMRDQVRNGERTADGRPVKDGGI